MKNIIWTARAMGKKVHITYVGLKRAGSEYTQQSGINQQRPRKEFSCSAASFLAPYEINTHRQGRHYIFQFSKDESEYRFTLERSTKFVNTYRLDCKTDTKYHKEGTS